MTYNLMNQHGATLHDKALNGLYYFQLNLDALCENWASPTSANTLMTTPSARKCSPAATTTT